jgi:CYTH domain-containing protein
MEIERKWMVNRWPDESAGLPLIKEQYMRQGYISVHPTVRIREEAVTGSPVEYILCFKSSGTLSRKEIELPVSEEQFAQLEDLIGIPLIRKTRRVYQLPDGLHLEVNLVDEGMATEFMYAEIEYESEEQANAWVPSLPWLAEYLQDDVTEDPAQTMGAFWERTRLNGQD